MNKPNTVRKKLLRRSETKFIREILNKKGLNTVCHHAKCPNRGECFAEGTATFLILGSICTRNCAFCGITKGKPEGIDKGEAQRVAEAAHEMGLKHVVITSVTRDDLEDGGAGVFAELVEKIKKLNSGMTVEILTPDFKGDFSALDKALLSGPHVFNHNLETVRELYGEIRPGADYNQSLSILKYAKQNYPDILIKSGIMVGLGENNEQLEKLFNDLAASGCDCLTIGQYLQATKHNFPVKKYYSPEEFEALKAKAEGCGIDHVFSGIYVRSSFKAGELFKNKV